MGKFGLSFWLVLGLTGCNIIVPNARITTLSVPPGSSAPASSEPWPSRAPASPGFAPSVVPAQYFDGQGPVDRLGPLSLSKGRNAWRVSHAAAVLNAGTFRLTLLSEEGRFVATLIDETETFEARQVSRSLEITGTYYMAVESASGSWSIDVNP